VPQLKIGLHLQSLRQPFKKALLTARRMGVAGVEFDARNEIRPAELSRTGLRALRKMLEDLSLQPCAVSFPTRHGYNVLEGLDRRVEATKQALEFAYALGARVVVNAVGQIPADLTSPEGKLLLDVLTELGRHGQHVGALLAARTSGESADDLARLLAALPDGTIGLDLDPGSLAMNGIAPLEVAERLAGQIVHVHARDGVRDRAAGRGVEVELGRGVVDFPALLGTLLQGGYRGYFTIQRDRASDPEDEIRQAVEFLRAL
jgi:sugar phosphate isomerase/epimerase